MKTMIKFTLFSLCVGVAQTANANLQVNFIESAPKDSFVITNIGQCDLTNLTVEIDLSNSAGKLIFDTSATGAGVEVFQPFEVKEGAVKLQSSASVADGDKSLTVSIDQLPADHAVSFTIDVDDTLPKSSLGQIRVAGSEVQGAEVRLLASDANVAEEAIQEAAFSVDKIATIELKPCAI